MLSNTSYVQSLYRAVLGRDAEPDGLQFWIARLDAGADPGAVAGGIWDSVEHRAGQVTSFYHRYLLRFPTDQENAAWVNVLTQGAATEEQVVAAILSSAEYRGMHPGTMKYVDMLYHDVLSREPDPAGAAYWVGRLDGDLPAESVALGFVTGPEYGGNLAREYTRQFLSRPSTPAEVNAWLAHFLTRAFSADDLAVSVLTSAEFLRGPAFRVRKNVRDLTAQEKADYVAAVRQLKQTPSPYDAGLSYYDQFVQWHLDANRCTTPGAMTAHEGPHDNHLYPGHMGPGFLPWHRQYVLLFEDALRAVSGKDLTIPYWDWTDAESTRAVFADDFMGPNGDPTQGYAVTSGPFRKGNWTLTVHGPAANDPGQFTHLVRAFGTHPTSPTLPTAEDVARALAINNYDLAPWDIRSDFDQSFRNNLEGFEDFPGTQCDGGVINPTFGPASQMRMHSRVHLYIGGQFVLDGQTVVGSMVAYTAPNDPIFFLHHNFVDKLWSDWSRLHGNAYAPLQGGPAGMNLNDAMKPFNTPELRTTPFAMLDTQALGYRYV